ncbi:MAG TPA: S-methyl-5-thioribose-1-phosphate isomerase, partial [Spirochaetes bacterium]|nr:S-methyl-5-thioribose-1-phosphate isomerase [Spirochaetota bacterium]
FWTIKRMKKISEKPGSVEEIKKALADEAVAIFNDDIEINKKIGKNGSRFIADGDVVMTHCNAGALATGGYGTALGVIRAAVEEGKKIEVYTCETRPYLQGARLSAWELLEDRIKTTLITDNMAGHFMQRGVIKKIIVGADRIAANGDTANKIGTYTHSVLAKEHGIPFYVAAPVSSLDPDTESGKGIPIEERGVEEVSYIAGVQIAPEGVFVQNPAFDVTPAKNITAIITEKGVVENPTGRGIREFFS